MDIPKPTDSGAAGTQEPIAGAVSLPEAHSPLSGLPLAQRFEGLAATRPRNLGGEVAATLIAGSFSQLSDELRVQRDKCARLEGRGSELQGDLATSQTKAAILGERLGAIERTQSIKQTAIFAGTALGAIAIDLYKSQLTVSAVIVGILGLGLLAFGWLTKRGGSSQ